MGIEKFWGSYVPDTKNINPNLITGDFLNFMLMGNLYSENKNCFENKNVTSIGWWFWILEMDMAKSGANVTIVDPMFIDLDVVNLKLSENIDRLEKLVKILSESTSQIMKTFLYDWCKFWTLGKEDEKNLSDNELLLRKTYLLLTHLRNWKENQRKYWVVLNPSSGDNIEWVDENSQDFVIIWHTLWHVYNKSSWNVWDFLRESLKLVKPWWKIYIIDYVWKMKELEEMFFFTGLKQYYFPYKWSFVCCFDRDGLAEFLDGWNF